MFDYKVVPFVGELKKGVYNIESAAKVSQQLQNLINQHSKDGWEFFRVDKVNILIRPGCLAALLGREADFITFDQVTFRLSAP